jgi:hypothetical protein
MAKQHDEKIAARSKSWLIKTTTTTTTTQKQSRKQKRRRPTNLPRAVCARGPVETDQGLFFCFADR